MKENETKNCDTIVFTKHKPDNIRKVLNCYKNILIRGMKGVGKITNTIRAIKEHTNVYYIGNPVDFEGKRRPGSYEKYLEYILSLKKDLTVVKDIPKLFTVTKKIILIIDEIYGRSATQLEQISRLLDMENVQVIQIVGCLKNMGDLIDKIDISLDLHHDGTLIVDKDSAKAICRIFSTKTPSGRQTTES